MKETTKNTQEPQHFIFDFCEVKIKVVKWFSELEAYDTLIGDLEEVKSISHRLFLEVRKILNENKIEPTNKWLVFKI